MDFDEEAVDVFNFQNESVIINEDDDDISTSKVRVMLLVCGIILIPMFCLLGSIGNILSLCVLFHKHMRNRVNYVLAALCVSDTLFLIHCLIYTGLNIYRKLRPSEGEALRAHVYPIVGAYGSVVTARITSCLTLLLCAERFVAVYFPMRARGICNTRNTCFCVILIYVITVILFIPLSLKYDAQEVACNNTTLTRNKTIMIRTEFYRNNVNFFTIYGMFLNIVFRFVPLVMITILNALMIRILHKSWKKRIEMSELNQESAKLSVKDKTETRRFCAPAQGQRQRHVTKMLLTVSFVFSICILPGALNSIASHIWPDYSRLGRKKNLYTFISAITFLLETINSSVNFIIYMALSRKFRLLYKQKFCRGHVEVITQFSVSSMRGKLGRSSYMKSSGKEKRLPLEEGGSRIGQNDAQLQNHVQLQNDAQLQCYVQRQNNAELQNDALLQNDAQLQRNVQLQNDTQLQSDVQLENDVQLQNDTQLQSDVQLENDTQLQSDVQLESDTQLQSDARLQNEITHLHKRTSLKNDNTHQNGLTSGIHVDKSVKVKNALAKHLDKNVFKQNGLMLLKCSKSYCVGDTSSVKKRLVHSASDPYGMKANSSKFYIYSNEVPIKESIVYDHV